MLLCGIVGEIPKGEQTLHGARGIGELRAGGPGRGDDALDADRARGLQERAQVILERGHGSHRLNSNRRSSDEESQSKRRRIE